MSADDAPPAHGRGDRRRPRRDATDRRSLLTRLPVVVVLVVAVTAALAVDVGERPGDGGAQVAAPAVDPMPVSPVAARGTSTWYCAAGTADAGGFADHTVSIQNPTDDDLHATLAVYGGTIVPRRPAAGAAAGGASRPAPVPAPVVDELVLPAGTSRSVRLADLVDAPLAAALVEVDGADVAVEHRVGGPHGEDAAPCSTSTASTWHLAWGSTARDARDVVVLFNPFPSGATVDARFVTADGGREPVRFQGLPVPPGSVVGVDVGEDVTGADQVAATFRVRSGRVVVERLEEFDGSYGVEGLSLGLGAPSAGTAWVFADGEASAGALGPPDPASGVRPGPADEGAGDDAASDEEQPADRRADGDALVTTERIVVYNPGDDRAEVEVSVVPTTLEPLAPIQPFRLSVGPGRFEVVDYGTQSRVVAGVEHATLVRSTNGAPVVAERLTVDEGPDPDGRRSQPRPTEVAAGLGARLAAPVWRLPLAGAGIGGQGAGRALAVFNPDPDRSLTVRLAGPDGPVGSPVDVPAGGRVVVALGDVLAQIGEEAGLEVEAEGPVVVERVVRTGDGRRVAVGPAVPSAAGAVDLGAWSAGGQLVGGVATG